MSDTNVSTPTPPTDPFAGRAPEPAPPGADGAAINAAHAAHVELGLGIIAEARNFIAGLIARVPIVPGHKGLGGVLSALHSVGSDLHRAEQYQQELKAFLPPVVAEAPAVVAVEQKVDQAEAVADKVIDGATAAVSAVDEFLAEPPKDVPQG